MNSSLKRHKATPKEKLFFALCAALPLAVIIGTCVYRWSPDHEQVNKAVEMAAFYVTDVEREIDAVLACESPECRVQLLDEVNTPEAVGTLVLRLVFTDQIADAKPALVRALTRAEGYEKAFLADKRAIREAICGYVVTAFRCLTDKRMNVNSHLPVLPLAWKAVLHGPHYPNTPL